MYNGRVKRLVWVGFLIVCLVLLAACEPEPTPTPTPTFTPAPPTVTPSPTPLPPTETPLPTGTPTPAPTSTPFPTPTPTFVAPQALLSAPGLIPGSWSPDGRYFSYVTQTKEDLKNMPAGEGLQDPPPGTTNFLDTLTGQSCQYPERNTLFLNFRYGWIGWTGGHSLQVLTDLGYPAVMDDPCNGHPAAQRAGLLEPVSRTLAVSADGKLALFAGAHCWLYDVTAITSLMLNKCSRIAAFSNADSRLALTVTFDPDFNTYIYLTTTGKLEAAIPSLYTGNGVGGVTQPNWISDTQLLVWPTNQGILLVTLGGKTPLVDPFPVASFNLPGNNRVDAYGVTRPDGGAVHIIFHVHGPSADQYYLYHAESRILETLPYAYVNWLDGGRSLLLCKYGEPFVCQTYWAQPVDPPASQPQPAPEQLSWSFFHSPDGKLAANTTVPASGAPAVVQVRSLPGGGILQSWAADKFSFHFIWSPDSSTLAVVSSPLDANFYGGSSSLYLLNFPH